MLSNADSEFVKVAVIWQLAVLLSTDFTWGNIDAYAVRLAPLSGPISEGCYLITQ